MYLMVSRSPGMPEGGGVPGFWDAVHSGLFRETEGLGTRLTNQDRV